jgi:hypothetical protein
MFKRIIILLTIISSNGCKSQSDESIILSGSWAPIIEVKQMEGIVHYIELYFTNGKTYYYESGIGLAFGEYKLKDGKLYTRLNASSDFSFKSEVSIENDSLTFELGDKVIKYYKVNDNSLGDLVEGRIDEKTFKTFYESRLFNIRIR